MIHRVSKQDSPKVAFVTSFVNSSYSFGPFCTQSESRSANPWSSSKRKERKTSRGYLWFEPGWRWTGLRRGSRERRSTRLDLLHSMDPRTYFPAFKDGRSRAPRARGENDPFLRGSAPDSFHPTIVCPPPWISFVSSGTSGWPSKRTFFLSLNWVIGGSIDDNICMCGMYIT